MAKIIEQVVSVKISKIIKDDSTEKVALNDDQYVTLVSSMLELAHTVLNDPSCVIEITSDSE
jgi:hypothetical protein